ncbi:ribosome biogenesis GTPase [Natranaerovirga pectinivora]|uniref:Small ribosomal subunit biogenesis GTPase RsgA n=1 Tax=Natranaerovirga pectinivora TaxID=682400 RepID=A0A4V2V0M8_9FIRM|nr:ribosome small subunit-dependent GTPase A [Natranaerovirga pectinivora]TCT16949.1 ribosome biogenesis GTPase [Natranaerovirga pectinivora]
MLGKIIKGIAGFYYVHIPTEGVYECKAKGIFRKDNIKPLVGDNVEVEILDKDNFLGNIVKIMPRKNELIRPLVSNIDQVIIVFAVTDPDPNYNLLDRFLVAIEKENIDIIICFNKIDILDEVKVNNIISVYKNVGYKVITTSTLKIEGIDNIKDVLKDKTSVFAGPSGVGKSSILNELQDKVKMETGEISAKIKRGKHTTRHAELMSFDDTSYIVDTPGFSSIFLNEIEAKDLREYFIEFLKYNDQCKFQTCVHINEPQCGVKEALNNGQINQNRYDSYKMIYDEIKDQRRW